MADIHAFLDRVLIEGLQRTNRYRCKLDLTQFGNFAAGRRLAASLPVAAELLREGLLCRTTMTPSRQLETTNVNLAGGYEETYAVGTTYNDLDCTFLCPLVEGTNPVLTLFHAWQDLIQNRGKVGEEGNMVLSFPNEYRLEQGMRLELFSGQADRETRMTHGSPHDIGPEITTAFEYFDIYPVTVSGTTVDWLTIDEMMEVAVNFSYTQWQQAKDETLNL